MKTLFTYDLRIQQTLLILFLATITATAVMHKEFLYISIFVEFFLIAFIQYSLNMIKFLSKEYAKRFKKVIYFGFNICGCHILNFYYLPVYWNRLSLWFSWMDSCIMDRTIACSYDSVPCYQFYDNENGKTADYAWNSIENCDKVWHSEGFDLSRNIDFHQKSVSETNEKPSQEELSDLSKKEKR